MQRQCSKNLRLKFKFRSGRTILENEGLKTKYGRRTFECPPSENIVTLKIK